MFKSWKIAHFPGDQKLAKNLPGNYPGNFEKKNDLWFQNCGKFFIQKVNESNDRKISRVITQKRVTTQVFSK